MKGRGLIDVGFIASRYSWIHRTSMETRKSVRLERALSCDNCRRHFVVATVRHLSHSYSDHYLVLLGLKGMEIGRLGDRTFRSQAGWLLHEEFAKWMGKNGNGRRTPYDC